MGNFLYRLFFTRDDDLDLLQVMFLICIVFFFYLAIRVGSGAWTIPDALFDLFKWVFGILAISGTPKWIAALIARVVPSMSKKSSFESFDTEGIPNGNDPEGELES